MNANLDRKTGYLKGYTMIEYESLLEAQEACKKLNGSSFLGKPIVVDFAFKKPPEVEKKK
jgi:RNA-binding protein 8A